MNRPISRSVAGATGLLLLLTLAGCADRGAVTAGSALPDWSGGWASMRQALLDSSAAVQPLLKPEPLAALNAYRDKAQTNQLDIRTAYCPAPAFGGYSGGFHGSIEFLFTPGRVTLIWEGGLVRRLYTDGRALPADPEPTNAGTSVAHWEGQTLVVKTIGLRPQTNAFDVPGTTVGEHAVIDERIFLKDPETLQIDASLEAPDVLTAPAKVTYLYHRGRDYMLSEFTACPQHDRSVDPATGQQRFDMQPPPDLPPPPKD